MIGHATRPLCRGRTCSDLARKRCRSIRPISDQASFEPLSKRPSRLIGRSRNGRRELEFANGEDYAEKLRRKADLDMAAAIEETDGMTLDDYRTIYHVALCDSAIAGKLKDFFEQRTAD